MARQMGRSPSTLSREVHRGICGKTYDAVGGRGWARSHRRRGRWKLVPASPLTAKVESLILGKAWSPGQIAGRRSKKWWLAQVTRVRISIMLLCACHALALAIGSFFKRH